MQDFLRWLAGLRGVPVEPGTDLQFEFAGFPRGGLGLLVLVGIALAVLLVVHAYSRDGQRLSRGRRTLLASLRLGAVAIAILMLLDPQLVAIRREVQPGHTLLLVDTSQSMGHRDAFQRPEVAALAAGWREATGRDALADATRIDLVQALLAGGGDDAGVVDRLRRRNKVLVYGFAATATPLAAFEPSADATGGSGSVDPDAPARVDFDPALLEPTGSYSDIGGAVRSALGRSGGANIAGVVIVSDGRRNLGPQGAEVARILGNRGVPATVVVPVGDPSPTRLLTLTRVEAPEKVFQKDPFTITAALTGEGYAAQEVEVQLRRATDGGEPVTVESRQVRFDPDQPTTTVTFDGLRADQPGVAIWSVEVVPPAFEAPSPERHVRRARIEALAEQTRVLLIAGGPSPEFRILRNLLTRDDSIEVACWLSSADADFPQDGNVSLRELPAEREELETWDVFVLVDPDPTRLDRAFAEAVAEQVVDNGAGLWWVAGEKFTLEAMREDATTAPLADLLPVLPDMAEADETIGTARGMEVPYRWRVTPLGLSHKATRIGDDRDATAALWSNVPGFYFAFPVLRAKPGAQVLVEHRKPTSRNADGDKPLVATQFVGSGRTMFTASDDAYRWRSAFEPAYDRFWVKGIRHLFEGRLTAGNSRMRIDADQQRIELGQALKLSVEARDAAFQPLIVDDLALRLTDEQGLDEVIPLEPVEAMPGQYQAWIRPPRVGYFRVTPAEPPEGDPVETAFEVVPAALEKEGPADFAELRAIAAAPGGVFVERPDQLGAALDGIASETRIEPFTTARTLWDSGWTIGLLTALLALEWLLRKRSNLL